MLTLSYPSHRAHDRDKTGPNPDPRLSPQGQAVGPLYCRTLSKSYLGQEATVTYVQGQVKCHGHEGKKVADENWM